jgi:hypothetical protein
VSAPIPSGWAPIRVFPHDDALIADCRPVDLDRLTAVFFDEDVNRALAEPFAAVFPAFADLRLLRDDPALAAAPPPAGLILHSSRCGSSLLVRLLQHSSARVIAEPSALSLLLRHSAGRPVEEQAALLRTLGALFCRDVPGAPRRPTFLKLEAWATVDLPVIRLAFPDVPWLFLYRDPVEVIVSHLLTVTGGLAARADVAWLLNISPAEALVLSMEELCARLLGRTYAAVLEQLPDVALLAYPQLPDAALELLPRLFGLEWSAAECAHLRRVVQFHAKHPSEYFSDDTAFKRRAATPAAVAAAERWAYPSFVALEAARRAQPTAKPAYA